jgi:nucleoside-diphosphate-sugar epimerase
MHVLVTGGTGFIGLRVAKAMLDRGWKVTLLDLFPDQPAPWWTHENVRIIEGDIRDPDTVDPFMAEADACWHLAAAHHDTGISDETYFSVNEMGTRVLCDAMENHGVTSLCFYSSVAVYGPKEDRSKLAPANPYGASKLAAEKVILDWAAKGAKRTLIVRPAVIFGSENFANMYTLIRQIDGGVYWPVGPGENRKSMAHVDNIVPATMARWEALNAGEPDIANYADKPDLRSREIAAILFEALGKKSRGPAIPLPLASVLLKTGDAVLSRVRGRSNLWQRVEKFAVNQTLYSMDFPDPADSGGYTLEAGLQEMVAWYKKEGHGQEARQARPPAETQPGWKEWTGR